MSPEFSSFEVSDRSPEHSMVAHTTRAAEERAKARSKATKKGSNTKTQLLSKMHVLEACTACCRGEVFSQYVLSYFQKGFGLRTLKK